MLLSGYDDSEDEVVEQKETLERKEGEDVKGMKKDREERRDESGEAGKEEETRLDVNKREEKSEERRGEERRGEESKGAGGQGEERQGEEREREESKREERGEKEKRKLTIGERQNLMFERYRRDIKLMETSDSTNLQDLSKIDADEKKLIQNSTEKNARAEKKIEEKKKIKRGREWNEFLELERREGRGEMGEIGEIREMGENKRLREVNAKDILDDQWEQKYAQSAEKDSSMHKIVPEKAELDQKDDAWGYETLIGTELIKAGKHNLTHHHRRVHQINWVAREALAKQQIVEENAAQEKQKRKATRQKYGW